MTRARTCLFGLVLAFAGLAAPRIAGACSVSTLDRGLSLRDDTRPLVIASDGVIAFDAYIRGESIEAGLARFSMTLTPDAGGPAIPGSVSHRLLGSRPFDLTDDLHQIVLVWRPEVSLPPGAYTVAGHLDQADFGPVDWTEPLTVTDVPAPPLSPPIVERAAPVSSVVEELDRGLRAALGALARGGLAAGRHLDHLAPAGVVARVVCRVDGRRQRIAAPVARATVGMNARLHRTPPASKRRWSERSVRKPATS